MMATKDTKVTKGRLVRRAATRRALRVAWMVAIEAASTVGGRTGPGQAAAPGARDGPTARRRFTPDER
jgi:hypothetical protein